MDTSEELDELQELRLMLQSGPPSDRRRDLRSVRENDMEEVAAASDGARSPDKSAGSLSFRPVRSEGHHPLHLHRPVARMKRDPSALAPSPPPVPPYRAAALAREAWAATPSPSPSPPPPALSPPAKHAKPLAHPRLMTKQHEFSMSGEELMLPEGNTPSGHLMRLRIM